jgi:hypothetical protein
MDPERQRSICIIHGSVFIIVCGRRICAGNPLDVFIPAVCGNLYSHERMSGGMLHRLPVPGKILPGLQRGVYLGNLLSALFYANRPYDEKFFTRNAAAGETSLLIFLLFPLYWFFQAAWYYAPAYLILFTLHVILFAPTQCEKCGYNTVCPGGKAWRSCRSVIKSG